MKKYVVYLVTYNGDKLPKYYIGSTSEDNISENGVINFKNKPNKKGCRKSTNGWKIICLK